MNIPERAANLRRLHTLAERNPHGMTAVMNLEFGQRRFLFAAIDDIDALAQFCEEAWARLSELADADCGCPWVADEVGEGGGLQHDADVCLRIFLDRFSKEGE